MGKYTVGLKQVKVGTADPTGALTGASATGTKKEFSVYNDTCEVSQDKPSRTEHKEENNAVPKVVLKEKQTVSINFQVMETDKETLTMLLGGAAVNTSGFGMDGSEDVENKYFVFETLQGYDIIVPNGDISASLSGKLSKTGILLVDVTVTPLAVTGANNKPFNMIPKSSS